MPISPPLSSINSKMYIPTVLLHTMQSLRIGIFYLIDDQEIDDRPLGIQHL